MRSRIRWELPDGAGVVLEELCALCDTPIVPGAPGTICPVCERVFCVEPCFGVHLIARDERDPIEALAEIYAPEALGRPNEEPVEAPRPVRHWHRKPKI